MLTIASMLALAYLMNYSGMTSTLGIALAATGRTFPFFSAILGWLGVFLTGSDTSANALFGNLQMITANQIGLNPVLTTSVNSAAGVMGKMIALPSIAVAVAATGLTSNDEGKLFRFTLKHSVLLACVVGLIATLFAYVFPGASTAILGFRRSGPTFPTCIPARAIRALQAVSAPPPPDRRGGSPANTRIGICSPWPSARPPSARSPAPSCATSLLDR